MNNNSCCIELSNVTFKWPISHEPLLSIASLNINYGEHIFIQGESGSGKSTLLNILSGVLTANSGSITILDQAFSSLTSSQRDQFRSDHYGIIFQQFNLIPYLSVLENVMLPLSFSSYKEKRSLLLSNNTNLHALSILDTLGISKEQSNQNVTQLSTGQQQRVAAARAFIGNPEIIIADEPTSALDENTKNDFIKLLFTEAKKFNSTIIFVSHDHSLSPQFDKCFNLNDFKPALS